MINKHHQPMHFPFLGPSTSIPGLILGDCCTFGNLIAALGCLYSRSVVALRFTSWEGYLHGGCTLDWASVCSNGCYKCFFVMHWLHWGALECWTAIEVAILVLRSCASSWLHTSIRVSGLQPFALISVHSHHTKP